MIDGERLHITADKRQNFILPKLPLATFFIRGPFNTISYAGHELVDMHNSSPIIRQNHLGPNPQSAGIIVDGGSPQILANKIEECDRGISFISPPDQPIVEDNIFLKNERNIEHGY